MLLVCGNRRGARLPRLLRRLQGSTPAALWPHWGKRLPLRRRPRTHASATPAVHTHLQRQLPCRPRRDATQRRCPHGGRDISCRRTHHPDDPRLGQPMCPGCLRLHRPLQRLRPELWRRFTIYLPARPPDRGPRGPCASRFGSGSSKSLNTRPAAWSTTPRDHSPRPATTAPRIHRRAAHPGDPPGRSHRRHRQPPGSPPCARRHERHCCYNSSALGCICDSGHRSTPGLSAPDAGGLPGTGIERFLHRRSRTTSRNTPPRQLAPPGYLIIPSAPAAIAALHRGQHPSGSFLLAGNWASTRTPRPRPETGGPHARYRAPSLVPAATPSPSASCAGPRHPSQSPAAPGRRERPVGPGPRRTHRSAHGQLALRRNRPCHHRRTATRPRRRRTAPASTIRSHERRPGRTNKPRRPTAMEKLLYRPVRPPPCSASAKPFSMAGYGQPNPLDQRRQIPVHHRRCLARVRTNP